jgi:hypothetical protein
MKVTLAAAGAAFLLAGAAYVLPANAQPAPPSGQTQPYSATSPTQPNTGMGQTQTQPYQGTTQTQPSGMANQTRPDNASTQPQGQLPQGSYASSCKDARMVGQRLIASCQKPNGTWHTSALRTSQCTGDIWDVNGNLTCGAATRHGTSTRSASPTSQRGY